MKRTVNHHRLAHLGSALAAAALLGTTGVGVAQAEADPGPEHYVEILWKGTTTNPDRTVISAIVALPPGGGVDWHRHPGATNVTIQGDGTFSLMHQNCAVDTYTAGGSFVPPRVTHTARNFSDEWVYLHANFVVQGDRPTVLATEATDEKLDARCGLTD